MYESGYSFYRRYYHFLKTVTLLPSSYKFLTCFYKISMESNLFQIFYNQLINVEMIALSHIYLSMTSLINKFLRRMSSLLWTSIA